MGLSDLTHKRCPFSSHRCGVSVILHKDRQTILVGGLVDSGEPVASRPCRNDKSSSVSGQIYCLTLNGFQNRNDKTRPTKEGRRCSAYGRCCTVEVEIGDLPPFLYYSRMSDAIHVIPSAVCRRRCSITCQKRGRALSLQSSIHCSYKSRGHSKMKHTETRNRIRYMDYSGYPSRLAPRTRSCSELRRQLIPPPCTAPQRQRHNTDRDLSARDTSRRQPKGGERQKTRSRLQLSLV